MSHCLPDCPVTVSIKPFSLCSSNFKGIKLVSIKEVYTPYLRRLASHSALHGTRSVGQAQKKYSTLSCDIKNLTKLNSDPARESVYLSRYQQFITVSGCQKASDLAPIGRDTHSLMGEGWG